MDTRFETKHGKKAGTHDWLTPPELIEALGEFDLDPCYSEPRPWPTARIHYGLDDNGLIKSWFGFVWCNPPYGENTEAWLEKLSSYKNALALIFARTETKMFFEYIWSKAKGILFLKGRVRFYTPEGKRAENSAGAPSCIIAWNEEGLSRLEQASHLGKIVVINN